MRFGRVEFPLSMRAVDRLRRLFEFSCQIRGFSII